MSTQELREQIHKRVDTIDDEKILKNILAAAKSAMEKIDPDFERAFEKITRENDGLFRRLAQ